MVAISSSASATRYGAQQTAVPQVRRAAEQAQQAANALQAQARDAWKKVDSAEAEARAVDARADQAISTAAQTRQKLLSFGARVLAAASAPSAEIADTGSTTQVAAAPAPAPAPAKQPAPAVINSQGQRIGTVINIAA